MKNWFLECIFSSYHHMIHNGTISAWLTRSAAPSTGILRASQRGHGPRHIESALHPCSVSHNATGRCWARLSNTDNASPDAPKIDKSTVCLYARSCRGAPASCPWPTLGLAQTQRRFSCRQCRRRSHTDLSWNGNVTRSSSMRCAASHCSRRY